MHPQEGAHCLATDQRFPGVKALPRQLTLLLIEAVYEPDPNTGEVNKCGKGKVGLFRSPGKIVT